MPTPLLYPTTTNAVQKTLDASLLTGVTASATLNNVTGIQNLKGLMVIDRVDGNNNLTPNKREYISFEGTSGSTVVTLTRGLAGSTDQDHAVGAIVEFVNDVVQQQAIIDGLLQVVDTNGALDATKVIPASAKPSGTIVGTTDTQTLTNKTFTSPKINEDVALTATATQLNAVASGGVTTRLASKSITATRDLSAAGAPTDVSYTGVGFVPTSIVVNYAIDGANTVFGNGFIDSGKNSRCLTLITGNYYANQSSFIQVNTASGSQVATVKSFDADGFTLTWTKGSTPTGTLYMNFLCFR